MLILTRRVDEAIVMTTGAGEEIVVRVLGVKGQQVRMGCSAAKSVTVHREEIAERIKAEAVKEDAA